MVERRIKSIRKVGNNGYINKIWETYETILVYKKAQKSMLLNKTVRNKRLQGAELQGSAVVAIIGRSHPSVVDVTELSSLVRDGVAFSRLKQSGCIIMMSIKDKLEVSKYISLDLLEQKYLEKKIYIHFSFSTPYL